MADYRGTPAPVRSYILYQTKIRPDRRFDINIYIFDSRLTRGKCWGQAIYDCLLIIRLIYIYIYKLSIFDLLGIGFFKKRRPKFVVGGRVHEHESTVHCWKTIVDHYVYPFSELPNVEMEHTCI